MHQKFLETLIPVQTFESEDRTRVAIVFERVNRMGIELDVFQLLSAWTWSDEFDLQQQFQALAEEFEDFGFQAVGDDTDLMLRCAAAVLRRDPSPAALVNVNGAEVREAFGTVAEAIRLAIDFVRTNFHVHHVRLLPYSACLIPLAAFFSLRSNEAITDAERAMLTRWFWRSCFSRRYSGNPQRNIREDIQEAVKLREGEESNLDEIQFAIGRDFSRACSTSGRWQRRRSSCCSLSSTREAFFPDNRSRSTPRWAPSQIAPPPRLWTSSCSRRRRLGCRQPCRPVSSCSSTTSMRSASSSRGAPPAQRAPGSTARSTRAFVTRCATSWAVRRSSPT